MDYEDAPKRKGFESPMARKDNAEDEIEGAREGRKSAFGRKSHRHKKRTSHRK